MPADRLYTLAELLDMLEEAQSRAERKATP